MTFEKNVPLNVQELGVILSALQLLDHGDENQIAKHYGSAPSLYRRLEEIYEQMDTSICDIQTMTQSANLRFNYGQTSQLICSWHIMDW